MSTIYYKYKGSKERHGAGSGGGGGGSNGNFTYAQPFVQIEQTSDRWYLPMLVISSRQVENIVCMLVFLTYLFQS